MPENNEVLFVKRQYSSIKDSFVPSFQQCLNAYVGMFQLAALRLPLVLGWSINTNTYISLTPLHSDIKNIKLPLKVLIISRR